MVRPALISAYGPILPTGALQQVGCYPGYSGRDANRVARQHVTDSVRRRPIFPVMHNTGLMQ
jgi:hypothetical protein